MLKSFPRGVHPHDKKEISQDAVLAPMSAPQRVYIPLRQHIGKAAKPVVKVGDEVMAGSLIADADGYVSAKIFASVSGKVVAIENRATSGGICEHIVIENDNQNNARLLEKLPNASAEQIKERMLECGIVGLGGAGFPTHVKFAPKDAIDTFIINAAECEPYITADYRVMLDETEAFINGSKLMARALGLSKVYIAIEVNKPKAIAAIKEKCAEKNISDVEVVELKTKYPQGAERQIIYAVTGRTVEKNKLPSQVGCVVSNVSTALAVHQAVCEGKPLYERAVTVTGGAISKPSNLIVKNGTLFDDIIEYCGGANDAVKIIDGGPMMGFAVSLGTVAATKTTSCVLLLSKSEACTDSASACINCAKCAHVCPMQLMPMYIDAYAQAGEFEIAEKYGAMHCIECGCCAYICPAKRHLVQSIREAKKNIQQSK